METILGINKFYKFMMNDIGLTDGWFSKMNEEQREETSDLLWSEVYGDVFNPLIKSNYSNETIQVQHQILNYLNNILEDYEYIEDFEACDIVNRLILITKDKIKLIEQGYAHSK